MDREEPLAPWEFMLLALALGLGIFILAFLLIEAFSFCTSLLYWVLCLA